MSTNSADKGAGRTGLGWPKRPKISRLLGWPFGGRGESVSRETEDPQDQQHELDAPVAAAWSEPDGSESSSDTVSGSPDDANPDSMGGDRDDPGEESTSSVPPVVGANHPGSVAAPDPSTATPVERNSDGNFHDAADDDHADGDVDPVPRRAAPELASDAPGTSDRIAVSPQSPAVSPQSPSDTEFDEPATSVSRETRRRFPDLPSPMMTRVMVVANQKGGVGKTTTSVNLAAALALGGLSVLVVDLDPQGNASTALGVEHPPGTKGTYEVLIDNEPLADHVVESPEAPNLRVLPATVDLAGAEIELVSVVARENKLKRALKAYLTDHATDYVLLDCPPSLGLLTLNALVAADEVLIPIQCEYYALEGVSQLMNTVDLVMGELNDQLELSTVLLTMYDGRTRLAAQVADEVRAYFSEQTLPTVIPRSVRISEAPSYGQTVLTYHPDSAGAVSYLEAAQEIARRGAKEKA